MREEDREREREREREGERKGKQRRKLEGVVGGGRQTRMDANLERLRKGVVSVLIISR